jgi:hypothetical protein
VRARPLEFSGFEATYAFTFEVDLPGQESGPCS